MENSKTCPLCAETINAAAKLCPHCRSPQRWWSLGNPQVVAVLYIVLCFVLLGCFGYFVDNIFSGKSSFADHRDDITVLSAHFSHRLSGSNLYVTVVGTITNKSNISWKNVKVESQFFGISNNLIDVITADADYSNFSVVILPHAEAAFKIEGKAARPETDYHVLKSSVHWAKDVKAWGD